ncbi:hypothetical protein BOW06_04885 [Solemya velum gill symbiont]|nr:hypothetical protein BOW06_04885 [Solemya velum gill symbiont]
MQITYCLLDTHPALPVATHVFFRLFLTTLNQVVSTAHGAFCYRVIDELLCSKNFIFEVVILLPNMRNGFRTVMKTAIPVDFAAGLTNEFQQVVDCFLLCRRQFCRSTRYVQKC